MPYPSRAATAGSVPLGADAESKAGTRKKSRVRALEIHDVVLAKLSRNGPRDRADVEYLARKGVLNRSVLEERFEAELRPNLLNEKREMLTLELWLAEFFGKEDR